jgi:hypothetical protein
MKEIHFATFIREKFVFKTLYIFTNLPRGLLEKDDGLNLKVFLFFI